MNIDPTTRRKLAADLFNHTWTLLEKREKSISKTSNIASASATNNAAMPRLNQGEALMVPKVLAVSTTTRPSTP